jgi:dTDP-4-amino-4,6-dideoxygalactose transaminase
MKKFDEIGGNFWVTSGNEFEKECNDNLVKISQYKNVEYVSSGRDGIRLIIQQHHINTKIVLLPVFTCESIIKPFIDEKFQLFFYDINQDLSVNLSDFEQKLSIHKPSFIFLQSYFGFDTNCGIEQVVSNYKLNYACLIANDLTHSWLSDHKEIESDFYVISLRKWLEIADGGLVLSNHKINNNGITNEARATILGNFNEASLLKSSFVEHANEDLKQKYRALFYQNEDLYDRSEGIFKMNESSLIRFKHYNWNETVSRRRNNYQYILNNLLRKDITPIFPQLPANAVPLYFPFYTKNRTALQKKFAENRIYAPIIWPLSTVVKKTTNSNYIYESILCLPIDQRYDLSDMERITSIII